MSFAPNAFPCSRCCSRQPIAFLDPPQLLSSSIAHEPKSLKKRKRLKGRVEGDSLTIPLTRKKWTTKVSEGPADSDSGVATSFAWCSLCFFRIFYLLLSQNACVHENEKGDQLGSLSFLREKKCMLAWEWEEKRPTWLSFVFKRTKKIDCLLPTNELQNATSNLGFGRVLHVAFLCFVHILCFGVFTSCMLAWAREEKRPTWFAFVLRGQRKLTFFVACTWVTKCSIQLRVWA